VRHYILTRSAYSPTMRLRDNQRRVELLARVTAASLRAQTTRNLTWLVLVDPADPLLAERRAAVESAGLPCIVAPAGRMERAGIHDRPYGPWSDHITWDGVTLTTRLDDDDALAPYALARVQRAAADERGSVVWTLPIGYRIVGRHAFRIDWELAQFGTLQAPAGERRTIFDVSHQLAGNLAPLRPATRDPAWLWVRHRHTRSRLNVGRQTMLNGRTEGRAKYVTPELRAIFPVDWRLIESAL
jgi:hypothetical protein